MKRRSTAGARVALLFCLALALTACGDSGQAALPAASDGSLPPTTLSTDPSLAPVSGSISAFDQTSDGSTVVVAGATIDGAPGWIVVHADDEGPGDVLGHAAVPQGPSTKIVINLDKQVGTGSYWPMLHRDQGTAGTFEWPGPDGPVRPTNGKIAYASRKIVLTVP